jgi:hypothetical protein
MTPIAFRTIGRGEDPRATCRGFDVRQMDGRENDASGGHGSRRARGRRPAKRVPPKLLRAVPMMYDRRAVEGHAVGSRNNNRADRSRTAPVMIVDAIRGFPPRNEVKGKTTMSRRKP